MASRARVAYAGETSLDAMSRHHVEPHRTAIGDGLQAQLRSAVGIKTARLIRPDLERAVAWYHEVDASDCFLREDAKLFAKYRHFGLAELARTAEAYSQALGHLQSIAGDYVLRVPVGETRSHLDVDALLVSDVEVNAHQLAVKTVAEEAARASEQTRLEACDKRGRAWSNRVLLALAVVRIFRAFDLPTLISRHNGEFNRVLSIAYQAAGILEPQDLMRDMAEAVKIADRVPPDADCGYPPDFLIGPRESLRPRPAPPSRPSPRRSRAARPRPAKPGALISR